MKKKVLGRGLNALIPNTYENTIKKNINQKTETTASSEITGIHEVSIENIVPNQDQPRYLFNDEKMTELTCSIREQGVIQPIIVKKHEYDGKYEIVCGERRYRAAKEAGLKKVPVFIKEIAASKFLEIALIENIQREDLNPIEEAEAYLKLYERGMTHDEIAKKVGKNRTTIVNVLRLLKLPKEILKYLLEKEISEGHARALLALPTEEYQLRLGRRIREEKLSVREVEQIVKHKTYQKRPAKRVRKIDAQVLDLERKIEDKVGSKVRVFARKNKGRIEISYFSLADLDRILSLLNVKID
jgi:ParB family transcriptional regulator, chromosome partitioning protein